MIAELNSIVSDDGRTTLPPAVREALHLKGGEQIQYTLDGDKVIIRLGVAHPSAASLAGSLKSDKGAGMTFDEIREAAARNAKNDGYFDKYR